MWLFLVWCMFCFRASKKIVLPTTLLLMVSQSRQTSTNPYRAVATPYRPARCNSGWTSSSTMTGPWCTTSCVPMRRASATKWRPSIPPTCSNPLTFLHKSGLTSPWQIPLFSVGTIKSQIEVTFLPYKRIPIKFQHLQVRLKQSLQRKASTKKDSVRLRTMQPWEVFFTWCQYMLFINQCVLW